MSNRSIPNLSRRVLLALCATIVLAAPATKLLAAGVVDTSGPQQLISTASAAMLQDLDANRAKYKEDKTQIYKLVDTILLPNFDVNYAAQQVLGQTWRTATAAQRKRFVTSFYKSLVQTYGDALVEFTADRMKILPFQGDPNIPRATVRTQIRRDGGDLVAVNYSMRKAEAGWKAWDVVIEGISYVKSFREDFGAEVQKNGLDALIQRLESTGGKPSNAPGTK